MMCVLCQASCLKFPYQLMTHSEWNKTFVHILISVFSHKL
jgi:hypothetical protein